MSKPMVDHTSAQVVSRDIQGNAILAYGATVPTDGTAGYLPGGLFINTAVTTLDDALYVNIGTAASCDFDALQSA